MKRVLCEMSFGELSFCETSHGEMGFCELSGNLPTSRASVIVALWVETLGNSSLVIQITAPCSLHAMLP